MRMQRRTLNLTDTSAPTSSELPPSQFSPDSRTTKAAAATHHMRPGGHRLAARETRKSIPGTSSPRLVPQGNRMTAPAPGPKPRPAARASGLGGRRANAWSSSESPTRRKGATAWAVTAPAEASIRREACQEAGAGHAGWRWCAQAVASRTALAAAFLDW